MSSSPCMDDDVSEFVVSTYTSLQARTSKSSMTISHIASSIGIRYTCFEALWPKSWSLSTGLVIDPKTFKGHYQNQMDNL